MTVDYNKIILARIVEIEICLENECYIAALALALTLPDVCGKAEYPSEKYVRKRYTQWFDRYVDSYKKSQSPYDADMPYLSGEVVYSLRNGFLHAGNPNIEKEKIIDEMCKIDQFSLKAGKSLIGDTSHVGYGKEFEISERGYTVNIRLLCMGLCRTAKSYYLENEDKFKFLNYDMVRVDD